jgi:phospholipid/cholesterol/gamma-HCH transport system substrate-binding protein
MKKTEFVVGLFIVLVLIVFGYMTLKVGKWSIKKEKVYCVYGLFKNVSGLEVKRHIRAAGVDIGYIKDITLSDKKARVEMAIYEKYKIPKDSIAYVKSVGFLGEKCIDMSLGISNKYLSNGDEIKQTESEVELTEMARNINRMLSDENIEMMRKTLQNLENLTSKISLQVEENRENFRASVENIRQITQTLKKDIPAITARFIQAEEKVNQMLVENREDVRETIAQARMAMNKLNKTLKNVGEITEDINQGKGTLGKLVKDEKMYHEISGTLRQVKHQLQKAERVLVEMSTRGEYGTRHSDFKGYVGATIYTSPDRFYIVEAVTGKDYESKNSSDDNTIRLNAEIGKKYGNLAVRGGIIESTFGVGTDYYLFDDNLKLSFDAFDFNHDNDYRDNKAHLKVSADCTVMRHFHIYSGVDEIINPKTRTVFIGGGMEFVNEDIKYMVTKVPMSFK